MLKEAKLYHRNDLEAFEEVNLQCDALQKIPHAIKNHFIPLHVKSNGNINFYNLLAAHYPSNTKIEEFKIVNKGRYSCNKPHEFEIDRFTLQFDVAGHLIKAQKR
ncbi:MULTISPECIES: hypothetical protein [unclassified Chitinophaga]|uniref:hypothetical protein n=1 Tax=unclassified Chitinophaga TaxID=2619133 RepID=UPI0009C6C198|nr:MULTISPECIES: hypothetical protein [unclassified Chitinophaga]OMP75682.1 hypothetical protein BW716_28830 [[Flexibacter] sp. ATCC 35208]WPV65398.1 hypothetical protein QQL36_26715 [Chitinophaga sp. LS1]